MKLAAAAGAAAMLGTSPALGGEIGDAARHPGEAYDEMTVMGVQADLKLLKASADAHHKAIGSISGPNGMTSS